MMIDLKNIDCLEAMKQMDDNQFDLAIVDPPYGINVAKTGNVGGKNLARAKFPELFLSQTIQQGESIGILEIK